MMNVTKLAGLLVLAASTLGLAADMRPAPAPGVPKLSKVMVIIFENADYQAALAQPFFKKLADGGALLSNLFAETHPSQPNYIALVAGDTLGVRNDAPVDLDARHLGDLLEEKGLSWKVYAEGYPGHCFAGATSGNYARKHVPFVSFRNVQDNPDRCARIVDASAFARDMAAGQLPDFSLYIPDIKNDGHDTGVAYADQWLARTFGPLLKDSRFTDGMTLILTFDEGSNHGTNQIYGAIYGSAVKPQSTFSGRADHYSLLRTLELGFGLTDLGKQDAAATPITGIWTAAP